ncbi:MAG: ATPase [Deltaproteobacteria bacterium]|nr:MAG: ATPase [Deltaproteobacteria bacterium]
MDRNMLSQHFGHAEAFLIADVEDGEIKKTDTKIPPPHEPGVLPLWMSELGVDVVITGGMGQRALSLFEGKGIKVVVGAPQMDPVEVIKEYIKGTLRTGENVCSH